MLYLSSSTPTAIKPFIQKNKYKIGISIAAVLAIAIIAIVAVNLSPFLWQPNELASVNQDDPKNNSAQDQSSLADVSGATVQLDANADDDDTKINAADLDDEPVEETAIAVLQPGERLNNTLNTLRQKISEDASELEHPMAGTNNDYVGLRQQMLNAINEDPLLLDTLLELFEQNPDSLIGRELAAVLSATGSPEAQTLALDMATNASMYANEERAAALLMIADMDSITSETRDGLLGNIKQETESDLTQFSLMALKNAPSTADDYATVHRVLQETLTTDDANVRRHASYQIGEWATSSEDLAPLRTMAIEELDINARLRAVTSLGSSSFRNIENKNTLYAVVENDENPMARLEAWKALETFPLSDSEKADYSELGERIQLDVAAYKASINGE